MLQKDNRDLFYGLSFNFLEDRPIDLRFPVEDFQSGLTDHPVLGLQSMNPLLMMRAAMLLTSVWFGHESGI